MSFVHLHLHTHYSLLDGLGKPEDYVARALEYKMPAVAITDHGSAYGLVDFYQTAKKYGVKPLLGCEAYVARFGRFNKRANVDVKPWHLILLAENLEGYQNLLRIVSAAQLEGYYYKPRVDFELLEKYSKGLIASSACLQGELPCKLLSGNFAEAEEAVRRYQKIFGEQNFFLEVQNHPEIPEQGKANDLVIELGKKLHVPLIATNDCHYVRPEDAEAQDVLVCVQTGSQMNTPGRLTMTGVDFSFKSPEEMKQVFSHVPEAITNTLEIAERCNVELKLGKRLIPTYTTPFNKSAEEYLKELCYEGLYKRYGIPIPEGLQRVDGSEIVVEPDSQTDFDELSRIAGQPDRKSENSKPESENREQNTEYRIQNTVSEDAESAIKNRQSKIKNVTDRLEYELSVINKMGFASYFLIVWDFVKFAKEAGIMVGPGRGSAAGSIISYTLGITDLDPLKYGLLFERFLNPERVSMPDIDIDFADNRREEVLEYVAEKYGRDHFARIITFGTLAAKAAVKDAGRVYGVPFAEMNSFSKLIPSRPGTTLEDALMQEPELREAIKKEPFKKIYSIAQKLEGVIRQAGVHACAVVIADKALTEYTPLQNAPGDESGIITQYSMHPIEDIGLLKMDFLGLRNLTIIQKCLNIIRRTHKIDIDLNALPMDDEKTFELFRRAETTGVFQFESSGMRRYLKELAPTRFEDLIAMVALFRPGPMDNIPQYIRGKHDPKSIRYPHPVLQAFLEETYGIAVYQEQVQRVAQEFAGFSLGEGYLLIKAVAKKIPALLEEQREKFLAGAVKKGHTKMEATKMFDLIEPFAGYGFNKSHAACYALIAYQTGYLKAHYPSEFMAALLTADQGNTDRLTIDIEECEKMGIRVLPPSVNESLANFTVVARSQTAGTAGQLDSWTAPKLKIKNEELTTQETGNRKPASPVFDSETPQTRGAGGLQVTSPEDSESKMLDTKYQILNTVADIRFGLAAIKGLGAGPIEAIIAARESGGHFRDIADFAGRVEISVMNKRTLEALAFSGALDDLGERNAVAESISEIANFAKGVKESGADSAQASLFGTTVSVPHHLDLKKVPPATAIQRLKWEKELLGMYVSAHPLAGLQKYLSKKIDLVAKLSPKDVGKQKKVGGIVTNFKKLVTKKSGQTMAFLTLEDPTGTLEVSIFPKVFAEYREQIEKDEMLIVTGRLEKRNENFSVSAVEVKRVDLEKMRASAQREGFLDDSTGRTQKKVLVAEGEEELVIPPFQIKLSHDADPEILPKIKALLMANKSEVGAEVEILIEGEDAKLKRIRVPFRVGIGESLAEEIGELVKS